MISGDSAVDAAVLVFALAWLGCIVLRRSKSTGGYPLPPGPKRLPIIGNALDMPRTHEWLKAAEWRKKYGDIVYLEIFGSPLIFLNSYEVTVDLLEKRSSIYSTRPRFPMAAELQKWDWILALMPYGEHWRKHRNALHTVLDPPVVSRHLEIQQKATMKMLDNLLRDPEGILQHIRTSIGSTILMLVYGHEVKDESDDLISQVEKAIAVFSISMSPGSFLVNALPFLKHIPEWFPGAGFQKVAKIGKAYSMEMLHEPYEMVKNKVLTGIAQSSMASDLIESHMDEDGVIQDEGFIARATATVYGSGADTTVSTLHAFIMAMVLNPEVQRRGQEELDHILGSDRLPTFEDKAKLPYIEGICLEVMRWANITPLGGPHASSANDVYKGYFIPKGTAILPIQWLMSLDPSVYSDPEQFRPERHIASEGKPAERSPLKIAFGFGRRVCPGRQFAIQGVFLTVANILAVYDISKPRGPDGKIIEPDFDLLAGLIRQVKPFKCSVTPRSEKKAALLRQTLDALDL